MKRMISKIMLAAVLVLAGTTANAQSALGNILGGLANKVNASTSGNSTLNTITNLITSKLVPTSAQIVGTWAYQEPAVMFTSENVLKNTASTIASKQIETKLQTYFTKVGITKGKMTITFNQDKTFTVNRAGKKLASGTYTLNSEEVVMTFKGRKTPCKVTPQLDNGSLVVVMDATKIKTFMQNIGSNVSQLSTVVSLLKSMDGMKIGVRMSKQ